MPNLKVPRWFVCFLLLLSALPASAHVGSPDVYAEGDAGPYKLFVVIRPPLVIPGVAEIEVRSSTPGVDNITITPMLLTGDASRHPPVPDNMTKPSNDAQFFTGHLWIMATGSWQVRFVATGSKGEGVISIPVPATAIGTRKMQSGMGFMLAVLGVILLLGMVGIIGAAARDAQIPPGKTAPPANRRRAFVAMTVAFVILVVGVILGNKWWNAEATDYSSYIYKPLQMNATVQPGNILDLKMVDPGWLRARKLDDFVLDHNHIMHLYAIRWPAMDVVFHLHPDQVGSGDFHLTLPEMPAGTYRLYADVVHANGFPETLVTTITLPFTHGRELIGDDAEGTAPVVTSTGRGTQTNTSDKLPDGYTMVWKRPATLTAKAPEDFTFTLLDANGQPAKDMGLYMGMVGHAAFVKTDGTVFAHIHPSGTVAMAALMMAQAQNGTSGNSMNDMPGMGMSGNASQPVPSTVSFPYGFPTPGNYRIFVQMKHANTVETGTFDAEVQ
ncbi:hypothetical protein H7849_22950 [Alloacidobacterium dinghuense]|uniref:Secreted protein n=1 Tax=Alloacidobacterium dinghuense TaxID=2763107 RepID=A0A7G8BH37_9BACT|nr:hypothetical protein [Alloacidobacterium dinghuense]QNI31857.1 hypothetical protein H7849_22950 [Alloacidobacterium dinghuense]